MITVKRLVEAHCGAGALSVTVNVTGCVFDSHSKKRNN